MNARLRFTVPGPPVPNERARKGRGSRTGKEHWYTPARTAAYRRHVAMHGLAARPADWDQHAQYRVYIEAWMPAHQGDWDNVGKGICDALNEVLWADDQRIADGHVVLHRKAADPRIEVLIEVIT